MRNTVLLIFFFLSFVLSAKLNAQNNSGNDNCTLRLAGKKEGSISLNVLKQQKALSYADTANCDYRLKDVEFIIKDKMGMDIISQTTPVFLEDLQKAIDKMEKGTKITITANIWTDKKHTGIFTQVMKFEVQ